jgi:hypothetical protein
MARLAHVAFSDATLCRMRFDLYSLRTRLKRLRDRDVVLRHPRVAAGLFRDARGDGAPRRARRREEPWSGPSAPVDTHPTRRRTDSCILTSGQA